MRAWLVLVLVPACPCFAESDESPPVVIVAEGERFQVQGENGWGVRHQDRSYASQAFGGMWVTHGGLLGAAADSTASVATQTIDVPATSQYRVWSKYQSPPYFNYLHRVEIVQQGRTVFSHDYGKVRAERMYSFCGQTTYGLPPVSQIWFPWGVDHDAAEAPPKTAHLKQGPAELRLVTLPNPAPAGDRNVDFVLLTTSRDDTCLGWQKHGQAKSPFMFEAIRATPIYLRFRNPTGRPARVWLFTHFGHFTWHCGPKRGVFPDQPVPGGEWSPWFNINEIVELFTDEGLQVTLFDAAAESPTGRSAPAEPIGATIPIEVACDAAGGRRLLGKLDVPSGETIHFPVDIVWNTDKKLQLSQEIAEELVRESKTQWRRSAGHKPQHIAFYGSFDRSKAPWAIKLKDALGYNTLLPDEYEHLEIDGYFQHLRSPERIREYAESLGPRRRNFRVCSFGDEIHIGQIKYDDPQFVEPFRAWLKARGLTKADLGVEPDQALLNANERLKWYAQLFGAEQRFAHYRQMTDVARRAFGPQVLTGANFSPHHDVLYYGNHLQWIDAFKHRAMTMFWTEDYIFFTPELPQIISFMFARMHCATKYRRQPIHMYVMPHAPGQPAGYFRRNMLFSIGAGAQHIDNFWVAPQENYSENYVSWQYPDTFRAIFESIYDTAAAEPLLVDARRRPARVAVVTGRATALNEDLVPVDVSEDPFLRQCHLAGRPVQNICRKDQQALYLALRHAQHAVDLITEDDIADDQLLRRYDVVYFAGEWIDNRVIAKLDEWVQSGGILYASTGLGHKNQFNEPEGGLLRLLGVRSLSLEKNLYHYRPLLELPLADPIDSITLAVKEPATDDDDQRQAKAEDAVGAIAFQQRLAPVSPDTKILGRWSDGSPAVTMRSHGQGKAYAVGTAAGATYLKTALRGVPWARGGSVNLYNPVKFDPAAERLALLGVDAADIGRQVVCSHRHVEALLLDNRQGTLVTLVNWTNQPIVRDLQVTLKIKSPPREVFSVSRQERLRTEFQQGTLTFTTSLRDADFVMVKK